MKRRVGHDDVVEDGNLVGRCELRKRRTLKFPGIAKVLSKNSLCVGTPCFTLLSSTNTAEHSHRVESTFTFHLSGLSVGLSEVNCSVLVRFRLEEFLAFYHFRVTQKWILWNLANVNNQFFINSCAHTSKHSIRNRHFEVTPSSTTSCDDFVFRSRTNLTPSSGAQKMKFSSSFPGVFKPLSFSRRTVKFKQVDGELIKG